ncbi:MAG TPA: lamin tail domain-containing protein, partial [Bryobacteraceae bacterium]|nr:lamin tail domain-containing protein [Bryobacteraceae bacterium]
SARWTNRTTGKEQSTTLAEKVRNVSPVRINEFRASNGPNLTDSFIELYNAGVSAVDLSNWSLTEHATQQAIFSSVKIPAGTKLASHGFYLFGLSDSGLAAPARAGDTVIHVRSVTGMKAGDTVEIGTGSGMETRKIASVGTAAANDTTLWQPLPEGPVITIPAGATNVPVTNVNGFTVGEKIALGYGATYPAVANTTERHEIATVTSVGKQGTQAYLAADAPAGSTNIQVTSVANISAGDKITLDIDSKGHGIETVTVTRVGTQTTRTALSADASAGATQISVRNGNGLEAGGKLAIGAAGNRKTFTIKAVGPRGLRGTDVDITPALAQAYPAGEEVTQQGTGLDLAAPLKFNHSDNLPFSDRGTGISFEPATKFAHSSNEPILPLGTGITLDKALSKAYETDAVVRDSAVTSAGYQGTPAPNQWFGGPALSPAAGSMVLRDAAGLVVDSLNYGLMVDPWAGQGYQAESGAGHNGCHVGALGNNGRGFGRGPQAPATTNRSAGRFPDGADTVSNCADFHLQADTALSAASAAGGNNIKVANVADFAAGQPILIDSGANFEKAVIAQVGTAGATTLRADASAGSTVIPVASAFGFAPGQAIEIDSGSNKETAQVVSIAGGGRGGGGGRGFAPTGTITISAPLSHAHAAGAEVAGSGITLTAPLMRAHSAGVPVAGNAPTPGAPNQYASR